MTVEIMVRAEDSNLKPASGFAVLLNQTLPPGACNLSRSAGWGRRIRSVVDCCPLR